MRPSASTSQRHLGAIAALLALAAVVAAGLENGLVSCGAHRAAQPVSQPVTVHQAEELGAMRYNNHQDGQAGFRAVVGNPGSGVHLSGWIDWRRELIYLNSRDTQPSPADGLVQAVPGLIAVHVGRQPATPAPSTGASGAAIAVDPYQLPPRVPPAIGWQLRQLGGAESGGSPYDTLLMLIFALSAGKPDSAQALGDAGARFLRRDAIGGVPVDVISGPAAPTGSGSGSPSTRGSASPRPAGTAGTSTPSQPGPAATGTAPPSATSTALGSGPFADLGGQVVYYLDGRSRLRRLDALLATDVPVQVEFNRTDHTRPAAIEMLGGAPVAARPITRTEAVTLARLRLRDRDAAGGALRLLLPATPNGLVQGEGWLNWRAQLAYLSVHNLADPAQSALLRVDRSGVSTRVQSEPDPASSGAVPPSPRPTPDVPTLGKPPLHPPASGWTLTTWRQRAAQQGANDLDILLNGMIVTSANAVDGTAGLRRTASWLRTDTLAGVPVTVFEIRAPGEQRISPGNGRLRYWVDRSGVLVRLELRTRSGAFGYLDLTPGPVPVLPDPVRS